MKWAMNYVRDTTPLFYMKSDKFASLSRSITNRMGIQYEAWGLYKEG